MQLLSLSLKNAEGQVFNEHLTEWLKIGRINVTVH